MDQGNHTDSLNPQEDTAPSDRSSEPSTSSMRYTRIAATLVLLVAGPMLLISGSALALFYASPERFNNFLARLPGEAAIRTVMIFAPASLVAIIVLALLYAVDPGTKEITRPQPAVRLSPKPVPIDWSTQERRVNTGFWLLALSIPSFLFIVSMWSAGFLSPDRFTNILGRIPGGSLIELIIGPGFLLLLLLVLLGVLLFSGGREQVEAGERRFAHKVRDWIGNIGPERLAVGTVLLFSIPMLVFSLLALTSFFIRPTRVLDLLTQLPKEVILRLGLLFIPSSLFIVVVLAVLFLPRRLVTEESRMSLLNSSQSSFDRIFQYLTTYGSWILLGGLTAALAVFLGLVVGMVVLLLR